MLLLLLLLLLLIIILTINNVTTTTTNNNNNNNNNINFANWSATAAPKLQPATFVVSLCLSTVSRISEYLRELLKHLNIVID